MDKSYGNRIKSIDIAKGLGILIVILGHVLGEEDLFLEMFIFSFHMPLFFILSGLVLKFSDEKTIGEILKCENKLIAAYVFYSLLYIVFNIPINIIGEHENWMEVLSKIYQLLVFYGRGPLWFLPALAIAHTVCRILKKHIYGKLAFVLSGLILLIVSQILSVAASLYIKGGFFNVIYYPLAMFLRGSGYTFFVILGAVFKDSYIKLSQSADKNHPKELAVCFFMTGMIIVNVLGVFLYDNVKSLADLSREDVLFLPLMIILALTGSISVMGVSVLLTKIKTVFKFFAYMGQHSLFIMATHLQFYVCAVSRRIDILDVNNVIMRFIFVVVAEIILIKILNKPFNKAINAISGYLERIIVIRK